MVLRNLYWTALFIQLSEESSEYEEPILTASFIQSSEESSESEEPILNCFIYSVIWGIQWIWGINTVLLHLFSDLRNPVNLRNLYLTARIQWIWGTDTVLLHLFRYLIIPVNFNWTYTELLYLFSDVTNPVNLRNLYCIASFIQGSEESSEPEESILYCFVY